MLSFFPPSTLSVIPKNVMCPPTCPRSPHDFQAVTSRGSLGRPRRRTSLEALREPPPSRGAETRLFCSPLISSAGYLIDGQPCSSGDGDGMGERLELSERAVPSAARVLAHGPPRPLQRLLLLALCPSSLGTLKRLVAGSEPGDPEADDTLDGLTSPPGLVLPPTPYQTPATPSCSPRPHLQRSG